MNTCRPVGKITETISKNNFGPSRWDKTAGRLFGLFFETNNFPAVWRSSKPLGVVFDCLSLPFRFICSIKIGWFLQRLGDMGNFFSYFFSPLSRAWRFVLVYVYELTRGEGTRPSANRSPNALRNPRPLPVRRWRLQDSLSLSLFLSRSLSLPRLRHPGRACATYR